jgi:hypothetical protein
VFDILLKLNTPCAWLFLQALRAQIEERFPDRKFRTESDCEVGVAHLAC